MQPKVISLTNANFPDVGGLNLACTEPLDHLHPLLVNWNVDSINAINS